MENSSPIFIDKKSEIGILMLHGFSGSPKQFSELAGYLSARGFTVYAPLIAGHGTTPEDFIRSGPDDWKDSVKKGYLRLKEKTKKIIIIGNSFGSNLGFWLASELNNEPAAIISLGAPVFLRWHRFIRFRLNTYGRLKRYYKKPSRVYRIDYTDMRDEVSYSVIPVKSLNEFLDFIEKETIPNLRKVSSPILIANANHDTVIHPKSAAYIFSHIGSQIKEVFWFNSSQHGVAEAGCEGLFSKIHSFIREIMQPEIGKS
ncbi:MAG: alpha/beta fold hydrolase [bacterium]